MENTKSGNTKNMENTKVENEEILTAEDWEILSHVDRRYGYLYRDREGNLYLSDHHPSVKSFGTVVPFNGYDKAFEGLIEGKYIRFRKTLRDCLTERECELLLTLSKVYGDDIHNFKKTIHKNGVSYLDFVLWGNFLTDTKPYSCSIPITKFGPQFKGIKYNKYYYLTDLPLDYDHMYWGADQESEEDIEKARKAVDEKLKGSKGCTYDDAEECK